MKKKDDLSIDLFDEAEKKFIQHLSIEKNERIIFSGKFGHGKTTFLKEFFGPDNYEEQYEVISLFPVNYSVASNEDIFKYIKYDIILEMLNKKYQVDEVLIDELDLLPKYLHENLYKIFSVIVCMIPQVGKDLSEMLDKINQFIKGFKEYHINAEYEANDANKLIDYIEEIQQKEGSIFEDNIVSNIIGKILTKHKCGKESILLIDDLDRLDPEHIFRILNVFAAHFDRKNKLAKNKFGFDKIILVCDIDNVRNIFRSKYGGETDFNGYIDKFYSYEIFAYSLSSKFIKDYALMLLVSNTQWDSKRLQNDRRLTQHYKNNYFDNTFWNDMLDALLDNKQIDLRNLLKWRELELPYNHSIVFKNKASIYEEKMPFVFFLKFLIKVKGDAESLKDAVRNIKRNTYSKERIREHITELVYINTVEEHSFKKEPVMYIRYVILDIPVQLKFSDSGTYSIQHVDSIPLNLTESHLGWMICQSIDFLTAQGLL